MRKSGVIGVLVIVAIGFSGWVALATIGNSIQSSVNESKILSNRETLDLILVNQGKMETKMEMLLKK